MAVGAEALELHKARVPLAPPDYELVAPEVLRGVHREVALLVRGDRSRQPLPKGTGRRRRQCRWEG